MTTAAPARKARGAAYAAIRRDPIGREWIDPLSLAPSLDLAQQQAHDTAAGIPEWDRANPVARYSAVIIEEI